MTTSSGEQNGATKTAQEVINGIDLRGKIALVTGAATGLGEETSRVLALAGATVIMAGRDRAKLRAAAERIRQSVPAAQLVGAEMELTDLDSIRRCAADVRARFPSLHILVNNAGVMACPLTRTAQGCEMQFGTNHIGHFLLTCLLVPALLAAAPARVVNLSSGGHKYSAMDFVDPHFNTRPYDTWIAYGQSKTANALFAVALNKRLAARGVTVNAVHPGMIVTELGRHLSMDDIKAMRGDSAQRNRLSYKSIPQGAATSVWAATSPQLAGRGGLYLEDCAVGEPASAEAPAKGFLPHALDAQAAEKLWVLSERIVGQAFAGW